MIDRSHTHLNIIRQYRHNIMEAALKELIPDAVHYFTVIMKRGNRPPVVRTDPTQSKARQRAHTLASLHHVSPSAVTYDATTRTYHLDASEYYK